MIELAASLSSAAARNGTKGAGEASAEEGTLRVPTPVRQLIARRLDRVGRKARNVMFSMAVLGRETALEPLQSVAEIRRAECLDALDRLHRARLVNWTPKGVRFLHALYAQAVYEQIHPSRRTALHGRAAEMQHRSAQPPSPLELARHYHLAGKQEHASMCAIEAVRKAESLDVVERRRVQEAAHRLSAGPRRTHIAAGLARSCYDMRLLRPAIRYSSEVLDDPVTSALDSIDVGIIATSARHRSARADAESALTELAALEEQSAALPDPVRRAMVIDARMQAVVRAGRRRATQALAARLRGDSDFSAEAHSAKPSAREVRCRTLATLALAPEWLGPQEALAAATEAVQLAEADGSGVLSALARRRQVGALAACGLLATPQGWEAQAAARKATLEAGMLGWQAEILVDLVLWHTLASDFRVGARALTELLRLTHDMDCPHVQRLVRLARCEMAVASGDLEEAPGRAESRCRDQGRRTGFRPHRPSLRRARGHAPAGVRKAQARGPDRQQLPRAPAPGARSPHADPLPRPVPVPDQRPDARPQAA